MQKLSQKKSIIKKINSKGYCIIKNVFNKADIKKYKEKIKFIYKKRREKGESIGSTNNQCLYNFFKEDLRLMPLVFIKKLDPILKKIIEKNYVLQSSNAQNRMVEEMKTNNKAFKIGNTWHTDSRYVNNKRISNSFSYLVIIALEDFTKDTASTQFIENSLKYFNKPKRFHNKKYKTLIMKSGSACIMDTGIVHRGGEPKNKSRWSIFNIYTPWFVKPYFNYKGLLKNKVTKLNSNEKKVLHYFSEPPISHNDRINTIL